MLLHLLCRILDDQNFPGWYDSDSDACSFESPPFRLLGMSSSSSLSPSEIDLLFNDTDDEQISLVGNELANTLPSAIGQANISELPSLGDLSATIGELSATMMDICSSIPHSSTTHSPSIGELSATIQEMSATILEISATNGAALEITAGATGPGSEAVSSQSQVVAGSKQMFILPVSTRVPAQDLQKWLGFKLVADNID